MLKIGISDKINCHAELVSASHRISGLYALAHGIPKQVQHDGEIVAIHFIGNFPPFTDGFAAFPKYR